jgi:hypothetical protein
MDEKELKEIKPRGGRRPGAGRPRGVANKLTADIKALAADYGEGSLQTLAWIKDHGKSEQARVAAAKELLDRAYGRPRQELDVTRNEGLTVILERGCTHTGIPVVLRAMETLPALTDQSRVEGE